MSSVRHLLRRWQLLLALACLSLLVACGGGAGNAAPTNVLPLSVDFGPAGDSVNRLYTSITLCQPGSSTQCQVIDHVLVDTGSTGLRVLASVLNPSLSLPRLAASNAGVLLNCVQFVDNTYAWGPVASADLVLGPKRAAQVPVQIIADPAFDASAGVCSGAGAADAITTSANLGAKAVLGLGLFKEDCGPRCATNAYNGTYYTCSDTSCTGALGVSVNTGQQIQNPIALFATDNNGLVVDLPAVGTAGSSGLRGNLYFGVNTQDNNQVTSASLLRTSSGYVYTEFEGQSLYGSFIDTGSNGLFFDSRQIARCTSSGSVGFYCPSTLTILSATLSGLGGAAHRVDFAVDNADTLFSGPMRSVLPTLAGPINLPHTFDWGLPFFYGRRVALGIEGQASSAGTGPYYAF